MLETIKKNPALVSGLFVVVLNALVEFGVGLNGSQIGALNAVVGAVLAIIVHSSSVSRTSLNELPAPATLISTTTVPAAPPPPPASPVG